MVLRALALTCLALLPGGCRCGNRLALAEAGDLRVTPAMLELPAAYVGQRARATVTVVNAGGSPLALPVTIDAPFSTTASSLALSAGESRDLEVAWVPAVAGPADGHLRVGPLEVTVDGEGLALPECTAPDACSDASFDTAAGACVIAARPEGSACQTRCIAGGACIAGACRGQHDSCDDLDACTSDSCSEADGCLHAPVVCPPPSDPCRVAVCDRTTGCGSAPAPDGTLCGPDDCTAAEVSVCIQAQCVFRARGAQGRCTNTWVPMSVPGRDHSSMVYDVARQQMVVFGGENDEWEAMEDTWVRTGVQWVLRSPAASPGPSSDAAMAYDSARQRVVLFGGVYSVNSNGTWTSETWEWDGTTWLKRTPAISPSARSGAAITYDSARQRVVLFGGYDRSGVSVGDLWEWDGASWVNRTPASGGLWPGPRVLAQMAYDPIRRRAVLFGGGNGTTLTNDTWEWDGAQWSQALPAVAPSARVGHAMAWDPGRQRVALFGGTDNQSSFSDLWEWDGAQWTARSAGTPELARAHSAMAYDMSRQRLTVFSGVHIFTGIGGQVLDDTWEFDGQQWSEPAPLARPSSRDRFGLTTDPDRKKVILFGGQTSNGIKYGDTWEFDGVDWTERHPMHSPSARLDAATTYDLARKRVVLFGGSQGNTTVLGDTWEYDGLDWAEVTPAVSPPGRAGQAVAYDPVRQVTVLFGGWTLQSGVLDVTADTWEYDGTQWLERQPAHSPPARGGHTLEFDPVLGRVVLLGGTTSNVVQPLSDEWVWDGTDWTDVTSPSGPPARWLHGMTFDPDRQLSMVFGGTQKNSHLNDTWELVQGTWVKRAPNRSPSERWGLRLAFEPVRRKVMLFGGNSAETWFFAP